MNLKTINPLYVIGSVALVFSLATGGVDEIKPQQNQASLIKEERRELAAERIQLELSRAEEEQEESVANSRYENNCLLVVNTSNPNQYAGITPGEPVIDMALNRPLADGHRVCDVYGLTGTIQDGVVADPARTGDRAIIQQAIDAQGINATAQPVANGGNL